MNVAVNMKSIALLGVPIDCGARQPGCVMGPDALRCAEIMEALAELDCQVQDHGNLSVVSSQNRTQSQIHQNQSIRNLDKCADWVGALQTAAYQASLNNQLPIFMGGDHLMAAGTVSGVAQFAAEQNQEQFVLWLDAHTDFHTLDTTTSGNLHGTPVAYFSGQEGFAEYFPAVKAPVSLKNICMLGIRSVDVLELARLSQKIMHISDMRKIDEGGFATPLRVFLERVRDHNGRLHVSLDVDFLDPSIAPAVGTTVPGGATFREAHLVMEILHDANLVTSLDVAELNPFLDDRGRTSKLLVDLVASLFGKRVMDRPTRSF